MPSRWTLYVRGAYLHPLAQLLGQPRLADRGSVEGLEPVVMRSDASELGARRDLAGPAHDR